jgi:hypothetical protein
VRGPQKFVGLLFDMTTISRGSKNGGRSVVSPTSSRSRRFGCRCRCEVCQFFCSLLNSLAKLFCLLGDCLGLPRYELTLKFHEF